MRNKQKITLAYTAGIIDGDGCVSISKCKDKTKKGFHYQLDVAVWSIDEWLIRWLKMQYGGTIVFRPASGVRQDRWKWALTSNKATSFLLLVLPYLNLKQPQAEIAISFPIKNAKRGKTDEELAVLEAQRILLSGMNSNKNKKRK